MFLAVLKFAFGTDSVIAGISNQGKKAKDTICVI